MGDHRADIKISFHIHNKTYDQEWWINYWPDDLTGVDRRIAEWFSDCWHDAYKRYQDLVYKAGEKERKAQEEAADQREYQRLKTKYESNAPNPAP